MKYTIEDCKEAILSVDKKKDGYLSADGYEELKNENDPSVRTIDERLGSWTEAKDTVGLESIQIVSYTDENATNALQYADSQVKGILTEKEYEEKSREKDPSRSWLESEYGSWSEAKEKAGPESIQNVPYTDKQVINALQYADSQVKGKLTQREYKEKLREKDPSKSWIEKNYGCWNKAKDFASLDTLKRSENKDNGELPIEVDYFKNIDSTKKAYFLGLIYADGHVSESGFSISLIEKDRYIIKELKECLSSEHKIAKIEVEDHKNMVRFGVGRSDFCEHLFQRGIDTKTNTESIPELSDKLFRHWLRGFIDGDGHICPKDSSPKIYIYNNSGRLENINERLNVDGKIYHYDSSQLAFYNDGARYIADYIYPNGEKTEPKLKRKFPEWY